jgi:hypothetical protein
LLLFFDFTFEIAENTVLFVYAELKLAAVVKVVPLVVLPVGEADGAVVVLRGEGGS